MGCLEGKSVIVTGAARGFHAQFDAAGIRLVEILNDRGYVDTDPQPQSVVWERMNSWSSTVPAAARRSLASRAAAGRRRGLTFSYRYR